MRESLDSPRPGADLESSLTWRTDDAIPRGARVEATDGPFGVLRERRVGEGPEQAYLGVETDEGLVYLPERLVRETRGGTVYLSLPAADARAHGSRGTLPVRDAPDELPREPR